MLKEKTNNSNIEKIVYIELINGDNIIGKLKQDKDDHLVLIDTASYCYSAGKVKYDDRSMYDNRQPVKVYKNAILIESILNITRTQEYHTLY